MKCDEYKREIKESKKFDSCGVFVRNGILPLFIATIIMSFLDKIFPLNTSIDYYMIPVLGIGIFYFIYAILYESNKVKGRFLFFER